ncbi:hypothetical protein CDAR_201381 [Caerostris darwini]|uniref:Uncharacterized protein n=1 Tax=Caerostris darwini TaxID=1538125 RepID=A0AAV4S1U1_9ARAC|nr:hypothetical protein CDAR_201381 [Caerostris darwini]
MSLQCKFQTSHAILDTRPNDYYYSQQPPSCSNPPPPYNSRTAVLGNPRLNWKLHLGAEPLLITLLGVTGKRK